MAGNKKKHWWEKDTTEEEQKFIQESIHTPKAKHPNLPEGEELQEGRATLQHEETQTWGGFLGISRHKKASEKPWQYDDWECIDCGSLNNWRDTICANCGHDTTA